MYEVINCIPSKFLLIFCSYFSIRIFFLWHIFILYSFISRLNNYYFHGMIRTVPTFTIKAKIIIISMVRFVLFPHLSCKYIKYYQLDCTRASPLWHPPPCHSEHRSVSVVPLDLDTRQGEKHCSRLRVRCSVARAHPRTRYTLNLCCLSLSRFATGIEKYDFIWC